MHNYYKILAFLLVLFWVLLISNCSGGGGGAGDDSGNGDQEQEAGCDDSLITPDIPFEYSFSDTYLLLHTPGGDLKTSAAPWGTHVPAYTGHPQGDTKANLNGLYATTGSELTELSSSSPNGLCDSFEDICGLPLNYVSQRIPLYIVTTETLEIFEVRVTRLDEFPPNDLDGDLQWSVSGRACNYIYNFDHVGNLHENLRQAIVNAGYEDPAVQTQAGDNLITGEPVVLNKGDAIGTPQIRAAIDSNYPDYYIGAGLMSPWAQIEFTIENPHLTGDYAQGMYRFFSSDLQDKFRSIIYYEATNPDSIRYRSYPDSEDWLTHAELVLNAGEPYKWDDYSTLYTNLWGWWEGDHTPCTYYQEPRCDESLSLFPIHKESPYYDNALYHSADVDYLIYREKGKAHQIGSLYGFGEVLAANPAISDANTQGTMTIKWRDRDVIYYQALAYHLDVENKYLKIRWGVESTNLANVLVPDILDKGVVCDNETTVCFTHNNYE